MKWNYRIVKLTTDGEDLFMLREVYYIEGKPHSWCEPSTMSETLEGMNEVFKMMQAALDKPVLDAEKDFL